MKITMLSTDYHPNIGGVAQHIFEITRALVAAGDEVEVIAPIVTNRWSDLVRAPWLEDGFLSQPVRQVSVGTDLRTLE